MATYEMRTQSKSYANFKDARAKKIPREGPMQFVLLSIF